MNRDNVNRDNVNNQIITSPQAKREFVENVKKWVLCDQQLKLIKDKSDNIRDMKHALGSAICTYMDEHNLSKNEIEITNGKLKVYEKKEYTPLTFSYIDIRDDLPAFGKPTRPTSAMLFSTSR